MNYQKIGAFCAIILCSLNTASVLCQDKSEIKNNTNITEEPFRFLLVSLNHCPDNMQLYTFNISANETISACDCNLKFLYYPANDSCYKAYRQGPCNISEYLILPEGEQIAQCIKNPCGIDGFVPYNETCFPLLNRDGPCEAGQYLDVDEVTFGLKCEDEDLGTKIIIKTPKKNCPDGSKRNSLGLCKPVIKKYDKN